MSPRHVAWIVPAAFFGVFFLLPVGSLLVTAGISGSTAAALSDSSMLEVLGFTVVQATASTVLTVVVALPGAAVLARFRFRLRGVVEALSVVAFVMPTVVVAVAIGHVLSVIDPGADRGLGAILVAHVYFNLAVVLRMVGTYWGQLDRHPEQAAACLGAGPFTVFRRITLPRIMPALTSAAAIVFLFTFTSFGIVLLLGLPGQATLEVEIQRQALFLYDLPLAAALSVVQMVLVIGLLVVQGRLSARLGGTAGSGRLSRPRTVRQRSAVVVFTVVALAIFITPVAAVLARALRVGDGWGWDNFARLGTVDENSVLFVAPSQAIVNSLIYAACAAVIATIVGGLVAWLVGERGSRGWDTIWLLPLGVSAVTLGFGILITFDTAPINWRANFWMVPVAQALIAIPFVVRTVAPALQAIGPRVRQAAATLGASPLRVLRSVELPLVGRAVAVALGFAFAISLGEFGATLFVARGDRPTVPIMMYRLLGRPGETNQGQAMALAAILIVMTASVILVTDRWRSARSSHV